MNAIIIGRRRQGKSTLAFFLAWERAQLILIWDPNSQYRNFPAIAGSNRFEKLGEAIQRSGEHTFDAVGGGREQKIVVIRFVPDENNLWDDFEQFGWIVRQNCGGTYAVIVDESDELQSPQKMHPQLNWFMRRAPTEVDAPETVHFFQQTHSPKDVYGKARNLASNFYFFHTQGDNELDAIVELTGDESIREEVKTLPLRHVLTWWIDDQGEPQYFIVDNPESWYINIGSNRGELDASAT